MAFAQVQSRAMKRIVIGVLMVLALNSCNTFIGIGRDFRQMGEGLENAANGRKFNGNERQSKQDQQQENLPTY